MEGKYQIVWLIVAYTKRLQQICKPLVGCTSIGSRFDEVRLIADARRHRHGIRIG